MRQKTFGSASAALVLLSATLMAAACNDDPREQVGSLSASVTVGGDPHDVASVRFDIVAAGGTCADTPIASKTVPLEEEVLPPSVAGAGAGSHRFADGLFVLAPGTYLACATPLAADGTASQQCAPTSSSVTVVAQQTNEVLLVSQCRGNPNGGIDVVVTLNSPPLITAVDIAPSKFITVCQSAGITVTASDPDGDALSYAFTSSGGSLASDGNTASFLGAAGDYTVSVDVSDGRGGHATLSFPIHVSTATCTAVPDAIEALFQGRCSTCHTRTTPPPAAGVNFQTAATAYASLVGVMSSNPACAARVRVIPGDAANSYIIAKLRAAPGICGNPMPLGRPPLPEAEINRIETWINALPH